MLKVSDTYRSLLEDKRHRKEFKVRIGGKEYGHGHIISLATSHRLFAEDTLSIGGTVSGQVTMTLRDVPVFSLAAKIELFVRLVSGDGRTASEWLPHGVYFIDTRSVDYSTGCVTINGYDIMLMATVPWNPTQDLVFPMPMDTAVNLFCGLLGCQLDPRTTISHAYTIDYPANDTEAGPDATGNGVNYTIRDILGWIAVAHGGNWIVTHEGKLLLVGIGDLPEETYYIISEHGKPINFGGVVIEWP